MPKNLHFYFLEDPALASPVNKPALETEAKVVRHHILVKDVPHFVVLVADKVSRSGGKIKTMVLSGHGGSSSFKIGSTWIFEDSVWWSVLYHMRDYFAPDAEVTILGCKSGQAAAVLQKLSDVWGGVKVRGWTGDIAVWKWKWLDGFRFEGDEVICGANACAKAPHRWGTDPNRHRVDHPGVM